MATSFESEDEPMTTEVSIQDLPRIPTVEEMETWDEEKLLRWIQQRKPTVLKGRNLDNFNNAGITGTAFLGTSVEFFNKFCGLTPAAGLGLVRLVDEVKKADSEQAGSASKKRRQEANQPPNRKRFRPSLLPGSDTVYETESAKNRSHVIFPTNATFTNFSTKSGAIVVDKTHFIPLLEEKPFRYMLLRPRRWGKSTFLNMLAAYYDVNTKDSFESIFGGLYIGKTPTKSRNSHLVLLFDFSTIMAGTREETKQSIFETVYGSLEDFLYRYRNIFDGVSPEEYIIPGDTVASLTNVLDLIYQRGYTAFVGVDEYDAPANTCLMAALNDRTLLVENKLRIDELSALLKAHFFAVMKQACGSSVAKYWLTGVLPAFRDGISPLTATRQISFEKRYQSLCGLTQMDVEAIVSRALRDCPNSDTAGTLRDLKSWYNGYKFSSTSSDSEGTVYNPQLVFVHLDSIISGTTPSSYIDEANAVHNATVLSAVGETGLVTIHDLVHMISSEAAAYIMTELSFPELMQDPEIRSEDVTWPLLYYLGIVAFSSDSSEETKSLCIPNGTMRRLIGQRIKRYLSSDPDFFKRVHLSYKNFIEGDPTPFIELLEEFYRQRAVRSRADTNEANVETTLELFLFEEVQCVPQLHLIADPNKQWGKGKNAFVDIFVGNSQRQVDKPNRLLVLELKNIPLLYLWKARQPYPNANPNGITDFNPILKEVSEATEEQLLDLKYTFWDQNNRRWVTLQVKDAQQAATSQLGKYIFFMLNGQGDPERCTGIDDRRVLCRDGGRDVLCGYVIMCIAGTRVICKYTWSRDTKYTYEVNRRDFR